MSKVMYIKPTLKKHSSGFRMFECGYILKMENNRVLEKKVVTNGADHVFTDYAFLYDTTKSLGINMDITDDGYIRIWGSEKTPIKWHDGAYSSMEIQRDDS